MGNRLVPILALVFALTVLAGCGDRDTYRALPVFERTVYLTDESGHLEPARLQAKGDTLFVSYNGQPRLDFYDFDLNRLGSLDLQAPARITPTTFSVTDTSIVVCDHALGVVALFDRTGRFVDSFSTLPDGQTPLAPLALTTFQGVAYVADVVQKMILAISLNDIENITERGELVLTIPGRNARELQFPSAVMVTADGRLLVGDAGAGAVAVYTCDGQSIYTFDPVPGLDRMAPQAIAMDGLPDPGLQDDRSFDPSGLRAQGRYHVADGLNGRIHMYNPRGEYVGSYPEEIPLSGPTGLAVDPVGGRIFVADPSQSRILVYRVIGE